MRATGILNFTAGEKNLLTFFVVAYLADCIFYMVHWSSIALEFPYTIGLVIHICLAGYSFRYLYQKQLYKNYNHLFAITYVLLVFLGMFRGLFAVDGYWGFKGWLLCTQCALSFVILFPLESPQINCSCLRAWNWYIFPVFILFFAWFTGGDFMALQIPIIIYFYILLFGLVIRNKWAVFIMLCGFVLTLMSFENRTGVIKAMGSLFLYSTLWLPAIFRKLSHIILHFVFYILPIVLLILGLTGTYNVFRGLKGEQPSEVVVSMSQPDDVENELEHELTADTRTFLYEDVIASAIIGDYMLFGRSVGRGNTLSGEFFADAELMTENERLMNEVQMLNIFTWMGLVGVVGYSLLFLQASCLGLFCSRNKYVPIVACAVAFHWALAWMEEAALFKITDLALFLMMGICYSPHFRRMSDFEFRLWFRSCFTSPNMLSAYDFLKKIRIYSIIKALGVNR